MCLEQGGGVCWLLNVPVTCECISGTDLRRQLYVLPHLEVADPTFHLTQSQYTDTEPTSPSTDPITPGALQGSHLCATGMTRPGKIPAQAGFEPRIFRSRDGRYNHLANEEVSRTGWLLAGGGGRGEEGGGMGWGGGGGERERILLLSVSMFKHTRLYALTL